MIKTQSKTKTQITINDDLSLIVSMIKQKYPIFDTNQTIEFLVAKGSGAYLDEVNLTIQDLKDIQIARQQIKDGLSIKCDSIEDLLTKLKS